MDALSTFRDLIALWPSRVDFAADTGATVDVVHKWAQGRPIPAKYFADIISAAELRGISVSADDLVRIAAIGREAA